MKVELKGNELVITIPCNVKDPSPSSTGKTLLVASESEKTSIKVNGKELRVAVNAYVKA